MDDCPYSSASRAAAAASLAAASAAASRASAADIDSDPPHLALPILPIVLLLGEMCICGGELKAATGAGEARLRLRLRRGSCRATAAGGGEAILGSILGSTLGLTIAGDDAERRIAGGGGGDVARRLEAACGGCGGDSRAEIACESGSGSGNVGTEGRKEPLESTESNGARRKRTEEVALRVSNDGAGEIIGPGRRTIG